MIRMMRLHQIHEKLWCARDTVKFCIMISFLRGCLWLGKDVILKCALMVFFILGCTLFSDHVWNWYDEVLQVGKKVRWQYQKIKYCTSLSHIYSRAWKMFIPRHKRILTNLQKCKIAENCKSLCYIEWNSCRSLPSSYVTRGNFSNDGYISIFHKLLHVGEAMEYGGNAR